MLNSVASKIVDGEDFLTAVCLYGLNPWIYVDLQSPARIDYILIKHRNTVEDRIVGATVNIYWNTHDYLRYIKCTITCTKKID